MNSVALLIVLYEKSKKKKGSGQYMKNRVKIFEVDYFSHL